MEIVGPGETLNEIVVKISGTIIMFFITINFYIILTVAIISDNSVNVYFNFLGEALIEYIMYALLFPIIVYSFYLHIKAYRKGIKHDKKISSRDTTHSASDYPRN